MVITQVIVTEIESFNAFVISHFFEQIVEVFAFIEVASIARKGPQILSVSESFSYVLPRFS